MPDLKGNKDAQTEKEIEQELIEEVRHQLSDEIKHEMEETVKYSKIRFTLIVVCVLATTAVVLAWYINNLQ